MHCHRNIETAMEQSLGGRVAPRIKSEDCQGEKLGRDDDAKKLKQYHLLANLWWPLKQIRRKLEALDVNPQAFRRHLEAPSDRPRIGACA
jgi:hypothetical protein